MVIIENPGEADHRDLVFSCKTLMASTEGEEQKMRTVLKKLSLAKDISEYY